MCKEHRWFLQNVKAMAWSVQYLVVVADIDEVYRKGRQKIEINLLNDKIGK